MSIFIPLPFPPSIVSLLAYIVAAVLWLIVLAPLYRRRVSALRHHLSRGRNLKTEN